MLDNLLKEDIIDRILAAQSMVLMVDYGFDAKHLEYSSLTNDDIIKWLALCEKIIHEVAYSEHIRRL